MHDGQAGATVHLVNGSLLLALLEEEVFADPLALRPDLGQKVEKQAKHHRFGTNTLLGLYFGLLGAVGLALGAAAIATSHLSEFAQKGFTLG